MLRGRCRVERAHVDVEWSGPGSMSSRESPVRCQGERAGTDIELSESKLMSRRPSLDRFNPLDLKKIYLNLFS